MAKDTKKKARKQLIKVRTPAGIAAFAWLSKPDTGGEYSDDKFKVTLVLDNDVDGLDELRTACKDAAKAEWGKVPEDLKLPFVDGDEYAERKEKEEFKGKVMITTKSKFQPGFVDAKRNELPEDVFPASGDLIKIAAHLFPYSNTEQVVETDPKTKKKVKRTETVYGISFQLKSVQLLEKRSGHNPADDFEDEDDYEAVSDKKSSSSKGEGSGAEDGVEDF